jgi:phosphate transport system substrate-binding protein
MHASCRRPVPALKAIALSLFTLVLAGCPANPPALDPSAKGTVTIKGSNTFGEELGPRLIQEYRRSRPHVSVTLESTNSGAGIAALLAGECDIAPTSRPLTPAEEDQARAKGIELKEYTIGYYGEAVIVHRSNPVDRLTPEQVRDIFTGALRNWREVGGLDMPILLAIRDPVSGTSLGFRELAMDTRPYAPNAKSFTTYAQLAAEVAREPGGIGYAGMHEVQDTGIRALRIGDTEPSTLSVNEGWYPYARLLRLYTNKATESPAARDFARFVQQKPGQRVLTELGYVGRDEKKLDSLMPLD